MSPIRFNPSGTLDIGTDPADLPMQMQGNVAICGAMTRCTNLNLDRTGIAITRKGSDKFNSYDCAYIHDWEVDEVTGNTLQCMIYDTENELSYIFTWEADTTTETDDNFIISIPPSQLGNSDIWRIIEQGGHRYTFAGDGIYQDEASIEGGLTGAPWSAILYNSFNSDEQSIFALNGTHRKRITGPVVEGWGSDGPAAAPSIHAGSKTGLTGDYNAKITYCRKEDSTIVWESNPSDAAASPVSLTDQSLSVTWTAPPDSQVTHIRVYRSSANGSLYLHDTDVAVGTLTLDTNTADTALGTEVNWTNHNRPPLGTIVLGPNYDGYVFILKDNLLYYCLPKQPEYWPEDYYIEISSKQFPLKAGGFLDGQLCVASLVEIYGIQGTGAGTFAPLPMGAQTGTVNADSFVPVKGQGIYHLGGDGVYLYSGGKDQLVSRGNLDELWAGNTVGNIPGLNRTYLSNCWMVAYHGKLYIGYPGGTSEYVDNILVLDLQNQKMAHHTYAATFRTAAVDYTNMHLLAGDTEGYIWKWEDLNSTDDGGTAIAWQIQSADFNQLRKYFPRYAKYDVNVNTGATAKGDILLDGASIQAHTIIGDRLTKKRLVAGSTGDRLAVRLSGSGSVEIYGAEIE